MKSSRINLGNLVFALFLIAAGALLFAFNAGALPAEYKKIVFSWQMLLTVIGFACLFKRSNWFLGLIFLLTGGFLLISKAVGELELEPLRWIVGNGWAIVLMVAGFVFLLKTPFRRNLFWNEAKIHTHFSCGDHSENRRKHFSSGETGYKKEYKSGHIDRNCIFGEIKEKWDLKNFKGGEVNSVFGGIEIDLSEAQLAEGVHHLELNSVFGGIVLYVPADWKIEIRQTQVFGHFADNRPKPDFEIDENRLLVIEAHVVFGGGEIKCK